MTITRDQLRTMNVSNMTTGKRLAPVHPGDVLLHDFIEPMGLTRYKIAKLTNVQQRRIDEICMGKRAITADTALRLSRYFGTRPGWWLDLQTHFDLETAGDELEARIARTVKPCKLRPTAEPVAA